jgi:hypothetical protein
VVNDSGGTAIPYMANSTTFLNSNGLQILCAGKDGKWGNPTTSTWTPTGGYPLGSADPGFDDLSNFSTSILGNGITN